jgi:hypothetical protein
LATQLNAVAEEILTPVPVPSENTSGEQKPVISTEEYVQSENEEYVEDPNHPAPAQAKKKNHVFWFLDE